MMSELMSEGRVTYRIATQTFSHLTDFDYQVIFDQHAISV